MTDLSDFKRLVYEPEVRELRVRLAETEQALDGAREAAATSAAGHMHWLQRGEAAEAKLASSAVLSREDTEKLRAILRWVDRWHPGVLDIREALALLDGRKEEPDVRGDDAFGI